MKKLWKKLIPIGLAAALILGCASCGGGSDVDEDTGEWTPTEPITLVVHNAAGSGTDTVYRALAKAAEKTLGVTVVIQNVGGGAFVPAMSMIADAEPDGYTIGCITESPFLSAAFMGEYEVDLFNDLETLMQAVEAFNMLVVPADAPYDTLEEFLQYVADHPDRQFMLGTAGTGGIHDITIQKLIRATGLTNIESVAYDGSSSSATAVAGGHIDGHVSGFSPNRSLIDSGHLKVIGTFKEGADRDPRYPDLQSAEELGYEGVTGLQKWGICVPAGTPDNVKEKLTEAFTAALDDEEFKEVVDVQGMTIQFEDGATLTEAYQEMYDSMVELDFSGGDEAA